MEEEISFCNIESLLLKLAVENQGLSQKKSEFEKQIELCKSDILEKKLFIETTERSIQKIDKEILDKQKTVSRNRDTLKSLKETSKHLLHYEHTLKLKLENTKTNFNRDKELYEERIANYKETFQKQKLYFCQSPLAQKLIQLQGETEEVESRIKSHDEKISTRKQELERLTAGNSSPAEKQVDSDRQPTGAEGEVTLQASTSEATSLYFSRQQMQPDEPRVKQPNTEEEPAGQEIEKTSASATVDDGFTNSQRSQDLPEPEEMHEEETQGTSIQELAQVTQVEEEPEKEASAQMDTTASQDDKFTAFPGKEKAFNARSPPVPDTPAFTFNFGSGTSSHADTSDVKSPDSFFSLHSESSASAYKDFGFNVGSPPEDSGFPFGTTFFNEKKPSGSKSGGRDFLFNQSEPNEVFQFPFDAKSPETGSVDSAKDEFTFKF